MIVSNISCKKNNIDSIITKSTIDTQYKTLYFDDDKIKDKVEVKATQKIELSSFVLSIYLSTLNKTIEIPFLNNSILYNNIEAAYYLSDPIIKDKVIELRIDYADQITKPNISGERKDLIEKIKFRFDTKNKKIQIIGYDLTYTKDKERNYTKSFNFLIGKYYSSCYFDDQKKKHQAGHKNFKTYI